ncbi:MAG: hypothetical protein CL920_05985 [Deltaproteobacteria bacterium]|nr:hypothetical protein [Deltaproteobacteria bacterium]MBU48228.1 hypothetical protein [Deltaproteobacteria bacterium]
MTSYDSILVIEDEAFTRQRLERLFSKANEDVLFVKSWTEAVTLIKTHSIALIVCDELLILLEDSSFHNTMRRVGYRGPLIFLSVLMDFHPGHQMMTAKALCRVIPKTTPDDLLWEAIQESLLHHRQGLLAEAESAPTHPAPWDLNSLNTSPEEKEPLHILGEVNKELPQPADVRFGVRLLISQLFHAYKKRNPQELVVSQETLGELREQFSSFALQFVPPVLDLLELKLSTMLAVGEPSNRQWMELVKVFSWLIEQFQREPAFFGQMVREKTLCSELSLPTIDILLVEDDEVDMLFIRNLLDEERIGSYSFRHASSLDEAKSMLLERAPTLCITDYHLGADDAFQLQSFAHERGYTFPFILLTGMGSYSLDLQAMDVGFAAYFDKDELTASLLERTMRYVLRQQKKEEVLAGLDPLTQVANLQTFKESMKKAIARGKRNNRLLTLLLFDVKNLKRINDTQGFSSGDKVLKGLASRLIGCLDEFDTVARLGGGTFAVLVEEAETTEECLSLCLRCEEAFAKPLFIGEKEFEHSFHLGMAIWPLHAQDAEDFMAAGLDALEQAKHSNNRTYILSLEGLQREGVDDIAKSTDC